MKTFIFSLYKHPLAKEIASQLHCEQGKIILRNFPDEESYLKIESIVKNKHLILVDSLDRPNPKLAPLIFFANTAKSLGAKRVGLVAPYLAYMRQDKQFHPGESITSRHFAKLLATYFDWLLTVDPHLHRYHDLSEIYSIPAHTASATPAIAQWIQKNIKKPVIIGPDIESKQWAGNIANQINVPCEILKKIRHSDKRVEISLPNMEHYKSHTPVLVDDIISTGQTLIETIKQLKTLNMPPPICIGVHAIFAGNAYQELQQAGAERIVTCNTVPHVSNEIEVSEFLGKIIAEF